jgi:imidazolonepropionase-like amidohydrolase
MAGTTELIGPTPLSATTRGTTTLKVRLNVTMSSTARTHVGSQAWTAMSVAWAAAVLVIGWGCTNSTAYGTETGLEGPTATSIRGRETPQENGPILIQADVVHLGDGQVWQPGMVLVVDGKIKAVASEIEVPAGATVLRVAHVTPGLIDAASSVGITGGAGEVTSEVTPEFKVSDAIDLLDAGFRRQVAGGVTTVHVTPNTENVVAGFGSLLKTAGESPQRWLRTQTGLYLSMCNDPTSRNSSRNRPETLYVRLPTNRMGVVWILRSRLHATRQEAEAATATDPVEAGVETAAATPAAVAFLGEIISGKTAAFAVSRTAYDIETLFRISNEFSFKPILVGGDEAYQVIELLKQEQAQVIFTALSTGMTGAERTELKWNTPVQLVRANIPVALAGDELLNQARFARRFGMSSGEALAAITSRPAAILGVEDRVGKIAVGMDADLVAFSGDPLQITSAINWVMIDGIQHINGEDQ